MAQTRLKPSGGFDYSLDYRKMNFREHPEKYQIGRGEQGVLLVEPYKSEILPHWRFATVTAARESANVIYKMFLAYGNAGDFVGMDMARKFLQMGFTRSRRYANHASGHKFDADGDLLPRMPSKSKAQSAEIFRQKWEQVRKNSLYLRLKTKHRESQLQHRPT